MRGSSDILPVPLPEQRVNAFQTVLMGVFFSVGPLYACWLNRELITSWSASSLTNLCLGSEPFSAYFFWSVLAALLFIFHVLGISKSFDFQSKNALACFVVTAVVAGGIRVGWGYPLIGLPPLYHDEYAYLFQAETFGRGRLWFPSHPLANHFDQMHVLNDSKYVSRFFPGTAIWLLPGVALGKPIFSNWLAGSLSAGLLALWGRRFSPMTGWIAGFLAAFAPSLIVFDNQLLSPSPTILFFLLFAWSFDLSRGSRSLVWPTLAGLAIGFALWTRPLTAFGLALPYAIYACWRPIVSNLPGERSKFMALTLSFALMLGLFGAYNHAITGSLMKTPYSVYLDKYTPSHVFGFYNLDRGRAKRTSETKVDYDDWASNLTLEAMPKNVASRWDQLARWSFDSLVPITLAGLAGISLVTLSSAGDRMLLPWLSILGLTVVYGCYAFPGILGYSYYVEMVPVMLLLVSKGTTDIARLASRHTNNVVGFWIMLLPVLVAGVNMARVTPEIFARGSELVYPRLLAEDHRRQVEGLAERGPVLVLYRESAKKNVHRTWVFNHPDLAGPVIRGWRLMNSPAELAELAKAFPDRRIIEIPANP